LIQKNLRYFLRRPLRSILKEDGAEGSDEIAAGDCVAREACGTVAGALSALKI